MRLRCGCVGDLYGDQNATRDRWRSQHLLRARCITGNSPVPIGMCAFPRQNNDDLRHSSVCHAARRACSRLPYRYLCRYTRHNLAVSGRAKHPSPATIGVYRHRKRHLTQPAGRSSPLGIIHIRCEVRARQFVSLPLFRLSRTGASFDNVCASW